MALLKDVTKQLEIPHEPGSWMVLRMLGWQELDESRHARQRVSFENIKALGGDIYRAIQEAAPSARDASIDPLLEHDMATLLNLGIVSWSYEDGKPTPASIATLDDKTAMWAVRVILGIEPTEAPKNESASANSIEPSME